MLNLEKRYATDESLENEGAWVNLGGGIEICVARTNNANYRKLLNKKLAPIRKEVAAGDVDTEDFNRIITEVMSKTILVNWRGIKDDKSGKEIPYSQEKALEFLTKLKDFRERVSDIAQDMTNYRAASVEEAEGNL